jgi:UDPglucose 6-dehydrogenase
LKNHHSCEEPLEHRTDPFHASLSFPLPACSMIAHKCPHIQVTIVDVNKDRIDAWNSENLPIYEPGLEEIVKACRGKNLFFDTDIDKAIIEADLIFVSVNTPTKKTGVGAGYAADLLCVSFLSSFLSPKLNFPYAATSSSALVASLPSLHPPRLSSRSRPFPAAPPSRCVPFSRPTRARDFASTSSPTPSSSLREPPSPTSTLPTVFSSVRSELLRVVRRRRRSSRSMPTGCRGRRLLRPVSGRLSSPSLYVFLVHLSSHESKLMISSIQAANALLAQRISSINALSAICEATGADVDEVAYACGIDTRIGPKFLKSSVGFGGSCFQKDILNLVYLSESLHLPEVADYWKQVITMNEYQKSRFAKRVVSSMFNTITNKKLAVLGFAFKKDTGDTRETPSGTVCRFFRQENAQISIYDPKVPAKQIYLDLTEPGVQDDGELVKKQVTIAKSAMEACTGAEGICVLTEVRLPFPPSVPLYRLLTFSFLFAVGRVQDSRLASDLQHHGQARHGLRWTWYPQRRRAPPDRLQGLLHRKGRQPLNASRPILLPSSLPPFLAPCPAPPLAVPPISISTSPS